MIKTIMRIMRKGDLYSSDQNYEALNPSGQQKPF
jgi:hypothetical protein